MEKNHLVYGRSLLVVLVDEESGDGKRRGQHGQCHSQPKHLEFRVVILAEGVKE